MKSNTAVLCVAALLVGLFMLASPETSEAGGCYSGGYSYHSSPSYSSHHYNRGYSNHHYSSNNHYYSSRSYQPRYRSSYSYSYRSSYRPTYRRSYSYRSGCY